MLLWFNTKLKCYQLKRDLAHFASYYESKAASIGYCYSENKSVEDFKRYHCIYRPNFKPAPYGKLRLFWVGANQSQDESGFLQALSRLCNVTVFTNREGKYGLLDINTAGSTVPTYAEIRFANHKSLLEQIGQANANGGIDILLGQMWANIISKETLIKVQAMGIPVINIAMDDRLPEHWATRDGVRLGSIGLCPGVDMVLTTCSDTCLWYGVEGCPALFWPLASDPVLFGPDDGAERKIDVLFIGNSYGIRSKIVTYLKEHSIKVNCYGGGWPNGPVNADQNIALSKQAKIILGIGTVGHCSDVYTLKLRDFDALMTGALYLTHRNPDLCRIFTEGEDIEYYESPQEAVAKISYYLRNSSERQNIGQMGRRKAIAHHSWDKRLSSTFQLLGLIK